MEIYFDRKYDDIKSNGRRASDETARRIGKLYPEAIWYQNGEDSWKIVVR